MNKFLWLLFFLWINHAQAQTGPLVSAGPSDTQASTFFAGNAPLINTNASISISVPANQHAYINYLQVGVCGDGTAALGTAANVAFTSTNLGGWTQQLSLLQSATIGTGVINLCAFNPGPARTHPLVSGAGPVTVTIVPPTADAHASFPINVEYYLAQ
jgi:hypothetical protein